MTEMAIEIRGYAYKVDGSSYLIAQQDASSRSVVAATVHAFGQYARAVQAGHVVNFFIKTAEGDVVWFNEPVAGLSEAIDHVRDDQRESDPDFSAREAVSYAREILSVATLDASDPVSYASYRLVLQATQQELDAAFDRR